MTDDVPEKQHPTHGATTQGSIRLGCEVMALRYDLVSDTLRGMVQEIERQIAADTKRRRMQLVAHLADLRAALAQSLDASSSLASFCEPWIRKEKAREGSVLGVLGVLTSAQALADTLESEVARPRNCGQGSGSS